MKNIEIVCGPNWDRRIISLDITDNIGIAMSGGIDSWVLYNILSLHTTPTIFNIYREDEFDNVSKIKQLTQRTDIITIPELTKQHSDRIVKGWQYILDNYNIDYLYAGMNIIPHTEYFPEFNSVNKPTRPWHLNSKQFKCPFLHLYKYHIIDLANQFDIDLSNTQSCLTQHEGHCGECWQCKEREWGFKQLENINE